MKTIYNLMIATALSCLFFSCQSVEVEKSSSSSDLYAVAYQQLSPEYVALCYQAFNLAELRLNEIMQQQYEKPLAVVVDIDETVLDNIPFQADCIINGYTYPKGWKEWIEKAEAEPIAGAVAFLNKAFELGVETIYISNRNDKYREPTLKNLAEKGFPCVRNENLLLKTDSNDKETRRNQVLENYEMALLIGDNLGDFSDLFETKDAAERMNATVNNSTIFGAKWIMLPNAVYGGWLDALLNNCDKETGSDDCLKSQLKGFQ
ncbi:MAG: 5'-nucleotidase, lipoprotein e(P4) family [Lentimicrobiaceae bacterium]|jgi:5'-nucleotidase (lipoprotein e(P4) family)|nr:5'-nucleotidase, lipoprotein e(P4) family [Lentimicrobiaceae bacterium]